MSEMKPLLDGSLPPDLAEMLQSAELDEPTDLDRRERRLLAALVAAPIATAPVGSHRLVSVAKWGLPLLVVLAGVAVWSSSNSKPAAAPAAAPIAPVVVAETAAPAVDVPSPTVRVEDLPSAKVAATPRAALPAPPPSAAPAAPSIADELAAIDAARAALAGGRAADALAQTQTYRTTFTTPHFSDEADALEIQSLAALGRSAEARTKAESFVASHPSSPYVQRVRVAGGLGSD